MYYVYILQILKDGSYYIGSACNITERLTKHNQEGRCIQSQNDYGKWCMQKNIRIDRQQ